MEKCPKCGFKPVDGQKLCPACGFPLSKIPTDKHGEVEWEKLGDLPIGSVQLLFDDQKSSAKTGKESLKKDNPKESLEKMQKFEPLDNEVDGSAEEKSAEQTASEETAASPEEPADKLAHLKDTNPVLAKYILSHKDGYDSADLEALTKTEEKAPEESIKTPDIPDTEEPVTEKIVVTPEPETATVVKENAAETTGPTESNPTEEAAKESVEEANTDTAEENSSQLEPAATTPVEATQPVGGKIESSNKQPGKNHWKRNTLIAALVCLTVAGGSFYRHEQKVAEAEHIAKVKKENQAVKSLKAEVQNYYTNDEKAFVDPDKVDQDLSPLSLAVKKYKNNKDYDELNQAIKNLANKKDQIQEVNSLFQEPAINGSELNQNLILKADQPVETKISQTDEPLAQLLTKAVSEADNQYNQLQKAKNAVNALMKNNVPTDNVTREQYDEAKKQVETVKNQELVKPQLESLAKIDTAVTAKEKAEAEKKAAEQKAAEEKAKAEAEQKVATTASAQVQTPAATIPVNEWNKPIMATDPSAVADSANSAWTWAPGIKEQVLQTCFDRGYIVEGGYMLEPVRIDNGEGYYNLYATTASAPLTRGMSDSELPMYLVTINCKTGWFRGNGSDHTRS